MLPLFYGVGLNRAIRCDSAAAGRAEPRLMPHSFGISLRTTHAQPLISTVAERTRGSMGLIDTRYGAAEIITQKNSEMDSIIISAL